MALLNIIMDILHNCQLCFSSLKKDKLGVWLMLPLGKFKLEDCFNLRLTWALHKYTDVVAAHLKL